MRSSVKTSSGSSGISGGAVFCRYVVIYLYALKEKVSLRTSGMVWPKLVQFPILLRNTDEGTGAGAPKGSLV